MPPLSDSDRHRPEQLKSVGAETPTAGPRISRLNVIRAVYIAAAIGFAVWGLRSHGDALVGALAATEPSLELAVDAREVQLRYRNLERCEVSYFVMDVEFLFSTSPFTDGRNAGGGLDLVPHRRDVIELPAGDTLRQSAIGGMTPGPEIKRRTRLSNPDLVDTIHVDLAANTVKFGPADGSEHVKVTLGTQSPPAPDAAFVTWTASPDAPYYCVEPWMGPPNASGHGRGLHWVAPGAIGRFAVEVAIG